MSAMPNRACVRSSGLGPTWCSWVCRCRACRGSRRRLSALATEVRILIFTAYGGDQTVADAVETGACGYLLKDARTEDPCPRDRGRGARSGVAVARRDRGGPGPPACFSVRSVACRGTEAGTDLSWRELEVLALLVEGKENIEIAQALSISPQTVEHHISRILGMLHVPNRTLAAVEAVWRGLV
jgi:DNA-binding NarL/FixJ family response regulator